MAFLLAIEGIDGSGKGTQAVRLCERLANSGASLELFSFPRYEQTLFGKSIADFLNGRFGGLPSVSPFLVAPLYAGDRFESRDLLLESIQSNDVVICDRYVPSNIAHQAAKLEVNEREELIAWIQKIEYDIYQLPKPDLVVLLDIWVKQAQHLILSKRSRTYTDKSVDLHEADGAYLQVVREVYQHLAATELNWYKLNCIADGKVRTVQEITDEIWNVVDAARHT